MAPLGDAYNVDWIVSTTSNVHVTNNQDWFTSYTPFNTFDNSFLAGSRLRVVGIGNVQLNLKLHTQKKNPHETNSRMIVLRDVLFAPSAVCNIYSLDSSHEYSVEMSFMQKSGTLKDQDGNRVGLIEILRLPRLRLHGQRGGVSSLNPDTMYPINAHWPHSERLRWNAHYGEQLSIAEVPKNGDAPYSTAERAWLKEHYGGEFNFLKTHEMTIHNEEDRAAGRFLVRRKFMQDCGDPKRNSDHMNKDEDEFDSARYLQDMEDEPMSHLADYNFSNTELKWIRTHYGHSYNFMMSHGLKPFDQEDCDEAKSIIKAIMAD